MAFERMYYTEKEIASMLALKPGTLAVWRCKGIGPRFKKVGRSVRYHMRDIDHFVEHGHPSTPRLLQ